MMKAIMVKTDNRILELDITYNQDIEMYLGGYPERVYPKHLPGYVMIVDEEGYFKKLEPNLVGTVFYNGVDNADGSFKIVGDIIILSMNSNYDLSSLTTKEKETILYKINMILQIFKFEENKSKED